MNTPVYSLFENPHCTTHMGRVQYSRSNGLQSRHPNMPLYSGIDRDRAREVWDVVTPWDTINEKVEAERAQKAADRAYQQQLEALTSSVQATGGPSIFAYILVAATFGGLIYIFNR